ncbi:MAG TPA: hypothetical protein VIR56_03755 [Solimonas sp.]
MSFHLDAFAQPEFVRNGTAGFVVSDIRYALAPDADPAKVCPQGFSLNVEQIFAKTAQGKRHRGESDKDYAARLRDGGKLGSTAKTGESLCMNPELSEPDPNFRTVQGSDIAVEGIDLDGTDSAAADVPDGASCPHDNFSGIDGQSGIDNQFYRVVGCSHSFQPHGSSNGYATEMLTGSWGILITLSGVDDIRNDDDVEVGFFANADPIQLSPLRAPLSYGTYAIDQDPRFRAKAHGRIKDGVLTSDPVDVRFHNVVNSMRLERALDHARVRMTLSPDGVLEGYLAGYTPVDEMYDLQFGYRNGKNGAGELAPLPLRLHTANGAAFVLGYTCPGAYQALHRLADGDRDAKTGQCSSISTQYRIKAIPAFVVDVATHSANERLEKNSHGNEK